MYHHDRRKNARGQAVVVLLAVLSFAVAGAGLGLWIGQYADPYPVSDHYSVLVRATPSPVPDSQAHINAIAARLGALQAELLRLNALGARLAGMSGLAPEEFDFANPPPQGGPELGPVRDYTIKELASELGGVVDLIRDRQRQLDRLEDRLEGLGASRRLSAQSAPAGWPVRSGYLSSPFGFRIHPTKKVRIFHEGVDLASPAGTPINAVADGIVTFSGRRNGYGKVIDIRHGNGFLTRYAHNAANLVKEGQQVRQGQKIATVGATGTATGPHLHFEVRQSGQAIDPMPYLETSRRALLVSNLADAPRF